MAVRRTSGSPFGQADLRFTFRHKEKKKSKRHFGRKDMRAWLATAGSGDSGKTRPPAAAREEDIRQQAKDAASCYFTDLLKLGGDRRRGAPSAEFKEKERARTVLVGAYVESYDVATNPMAAEGQKVMAARAGGTAVAMLVPSQVSPVVVGEKEGG